MEGKRHHLDVSNMFGPFAEDKEAAIKYRNNRLMPAVEHDEDILLDFSDVTSAPHGFPSALLATPIKCTGMKAYKKIEIVNAAVEIRVIIDFIMDENT
uniref:Uncharacterized protein n=1 Tax=Candidatus Kentrum sp. FW TaxID=2126338 RepID=A0A450T5C8_9GAMM|nr:MAG: hypothetical protein BECKFW1821B_GA0114236_10685 [Candidatus Kentron sp. FW]